MAGIMTIRDIAGFCPEEAIWKMIADVSECLIKDFVDSGLSPEAVLIDGNSFLVNHVQDVANEFMAPEHKSGSNCDEKEMVWSLGAVGYYATTGHIAFGGHGGRYQRNRPSVPLPVLPKGLHDLTMVLQKCLCYKPEERIALKELHDLAQKGLLKCRQEMRKKKEPVKDGDIKKELKYTGEKWPEEMIEV